MNQDHPARPATFRVRACDGRWLQAAAYVPDNPSRLAVIAPAMGTRSTFYQHLGRWLADHDIVAVTFDYRGLESGAALRREKADLDRWIDDADDILGMVAGRWPDLPMTWIGHSFGGQYVPLLTGAGRVDRLVTVATGSGYWRLYRPRLRRKAPLLWWGIVPAAVRLLGYYPGVRLGIPPDMPGNAMRQWRRWCLHPDYLQADHPEAAALFASFTAPVATLTIADDEILTEDSVENIARWYASAPVTSSTVVGSDGRRVGHHGVFLAGREALWERYLTPHLANC